MEAEEGMTEIVKRYSALVDLYSRYRPVPPKDLIDFVRSMAPPGEGIRVVDLGCGTGLSTRVWAGICDEITGVDPSEDMLEAARATTSEECVAFRQGWGHTTGLQDRYASIVTCAASFHWMEPESTLREVRRILRPGGVFAIYGPQVPPIPKGCYLVAALCENFLDFVKQKDFREVGENTPRAIKWAEILRLLKEPGRASYCNEICFHEKVYWTAAELCMWLLTISYVHNRITAEDDLVITKFKQLQDECTRLLGDKSHHFLWCYRLILSIF